MSDTPPQPRQPEKRPSEMTTDEAMAYVFPPEVVSQLKEMVDEASSETRRKRPRPQS
jgi:hypothetical protein